VRFIEAPSKAWKGPAMHRISQTVRSTHNQDGAIVLDIRQGQMFNLNYVGSRILELVIAGTADQVIVDTISQEFGVGREMVASDVQEFLRALEAYQLLEKQTSAATI
jgi:hypothetical protein